MYNYVCEGFNMIDLPNYHEDIEKDLILILGGKHTVSELKDKQDFIALDVIKFKLAHRLKERYDEATVKEFCSISPYVLQDMIEEQKIFGKSVTTYDFDLGLYVDVPSYALQDPGITLFEEYILD